MMERIEVRYKPLDTVPWIFHKYIVYTDSNNTQHVAEVQWQREDLGLTQGLTYIDANGQRLSPDPTMRADIGSIDNQEFADFIGWAARSDDHVEKIPPDDPGAAWATIRRTMLGFEGRPYNLLGPNSNSAVDTALVRAGLPTPVNDTDDTRPSPGSDIMIPHRQA